MSQNRTEQNRTEQNRREKVWKRTVIVIVFTDVMALVVLGLLVRDRIQSDSGPTYFNMGLGFGFIIAITVLLYVGGRLVKGLVSRITSDKR